MNLIIKNGTVINSDGRRIADVAVSGGKITAVEENIDTGGQAYCVASPVRCNTVSLSPCVNILFYRSYFSAADRNVSFMSAVSIYNSSVFDDQVHILRNCSTFITNIVAPPTETSTGMGER